MRNEGFGVAACENCGQHIEFPSEGAGLNVPCPHCGQETTLAALLAEEAAPQEEITAAELSAALSGTLGRRRIPVFYHLGLLLVAVFMVLLPLVYLAFAAFAAFCVYWYAVHAWRIIFTGFSGGLYGMVLKVIAYLGPLIGGVIAVFFLFKPLLAPRRKTAEPVELNPAQHPRLYQFVAHLSDLLRVAMPKRIYLECNLNAGAGLRRGWMSLLGNDLVLTLGLPMVAGLNTRQLAAIIAHELGHCTQAFAMRLTFVINRIDGWFVRVVYERDEWDQAFEDWSNSVDDWRLSLIVACAHLAVWFSRKVLTLLMMLGHTASCFLSRQMEFHADMCATAVAGCAGVETSLIRTRELAVLEQLGYNGLQQFWKQRHQLPDSLPDFLSLLEQQLPARFHEDARQTLLNEKAGLFDTHPTSNRRIQKARQRGEAGIFALEKPARGLFSDFAAISQSVTARHYRQSLRLPVTQAMLRPASSFFEKKDQAASTPALPEPASALSNAEPGKLRLRRS
jgi:Zn-dependent protease with chaperone function